MAARSEPTGTKKAQKPELGQMLGLSPATVLDRFQAGDLPGFRVFRRRGGPVRFRLSEIETALEAWHVNAKAARAAVRKHQPQVEHRMTEGRS